MDFFSHRHRVTVLICGVCAFVTLMLMLAGTIAATRARSVREEQQKLVAKGLPPGPGAETDLIVRLFSAVSTLIPTAEFSLRGEIVRRGRTAPKSPELVFLAVDDLSIGIEPLDLEVTAKDIPRESRDFRALNLMSQGWPYNREVHALAIDKLIQAGARAIMLDFVFPKPAGGDRALQTALERHRDKVTIVCNYVPATEEGGSITSGAGKSVIQLPPSTILPTEESREVVGLTNFFPSDVDGTIWTAPYRVSERALAGYPPIQDPNDEYLALSAKTAVKLERAQAIPPGLAFTHFRYAGPAGTFKPLSFQEIFFPRLWERNFKNGELLRDKVIVLGPFGNWSQDFQPTPFGSMPGPEVHLHALNALLTQSFLQPTPTWLAVLEVLAACLGVGLLSRTQLRPGIRFALAALGSVLLIAAAALTYNYLNLYVFTAAPLLALASCSLAVFVHDFALERLERARTRKFLERSMSANLVRAVLDQPGFYEKMRAGQRMPVSILFSDIRSFTTMTESSDEAALVVQLNEYMDRMVECVFKHNGTLDKFIGDAVMAVWGNTPTTKGPREDACDAVRCALEMLDRLRELNLRWKEEGRPELRIGIGVNSGDAIVGEIGSSQKMEITVIGDAVNTASRFEGLTKEYHLDFLIGENTAAHVRDKFVLQHADYNAPKGKTHHVEIFAVLAEDREGARERLQAAGLADYEAGVRAYRERCLLNPKSGETSTPELVAPRRQAAAAAAEAFARAQQLRPNDFLIDRYASIVAARQAEGDDALWTLVTVMTKK